jgi:hypothetical protein
MRHVEETYEQPMPCPECDEDTPHDMREGVDSGGLEFTEGECQRCGYTGAICTGTRPELRDVATGTRARR